MFEICLANGKLLFSFYDWFIVAVISLVQFSLEKTSQFSNKEKITSIINKMTGIKRKRSGLIKESTKRAKYSVPGLPFGLICFIFSYLTTEEKFIIRKVSKKFELAFSSNISWQSFERTIKTPKEIFENICLNKNLFLSKIDLESCTVEEEMNLKYFKNLESVNLSKV
jgi:hypothetical protein